MARRQVAPALDAMVELAATLSPQGELAPKARAELRALLGVVNALDRHVRSHEAGGDLSYDFERVMEARARLSRAGRKESKP